MDHHVPGFNCGSFFFLGLQSFAGSGHSLPFTSRQNLTFASTCSVRCSQILKAALMSRCQGWKLQEGNCSPGFCMETELALGAENTVAVVSFHALKFGDLV